MVMDATQQLVGMGDSLKTLAHEYLTLKAGRPNDTTVSAQVLLAAAEENFNDSFWQTHDKASRLLEAIRLSPEGSKRSTLFQELDTLSRLLEDKVQALKDTRDDAASDTASLAALGFGIGGAILLAGLGASVGVVLAGGAVITGVGHVVGQWVAGREEADLAEAALIAGTTAVGGAVTVRFEAVALGQAANGLEKLLISTSAGMAGGGIGGIGLGVTRMTEEDSGAVKAEKLIRGMGEGMAVGGAVGLGLRTVHSAATYLKTTLIPKLNGIDPLPKLWERFTLPKSKAVTAGTAVEGSAEELTGIRFLRSEHNQDGVILRPDGTEMPLLERARRAFGVDSGVTHNGIHQAKAQLREDLYNATDMGEGPWIDGKIGEYEEILLVEADRLFSTSQARKAVLSGGTPQGTSTAASPARPALKPVDPTRPGIVRQSMYMLGVDETATSAEIRQAASALRQQFDIEAAETRNAFEPQQIVQSLKHIDDAEKILLALLRVQSGKVRPVARSGAPIAPAGEERVLDSRILDSRGNAAWELLDLPNTPQTQSEIKEAVRKKLTSIGWDDTMPDREIAEIEAREVVRINDAGVYLLQLLKRVVI